MKREAEIHAALNAERHAFRRKLQADATATAKQADGNCVQSVAEIRESRDAGAAWQLAVNRIAELSAEYRAKAHATVGHIEIDPPFTMQPCATRLASMPSRGLHDTGQHSEFGPPAIPFSRSKGYLQRW